MNAGRLFGSFAALAVLAALKACGGGGSGVVVPPAQSPPLLPVSGQQWNTSVNFNGTAVSTYGCGAVAFASAPSLGDTYVGRQMNGPPNSCSGTSWSLVWAKMNWGSSSIATTGTLIDTSLGRVALADGTFIQSALDPALAVYGNQLWLAFECQYATLTSTCGGPIAGDGTFDLAHARVLVSGDDQSSASDPKLLVFGGSMYLYWSRVNYRDGTVTTRGTQLQVLGGLLYAHDTLASAGTEVYGLSTDNAGIADIFQVTTDGSAIYLTAGKGGAGCVTPISGTPGCYKLAIGKTPVPLGSDVFNSAQWIPDSQIPQYPQEYYRFVYRPSDGATVLLGGNGEAPTQPNGALGGTWSFVWPENLLHS